MIRPFTGRWSFCLLAVFLLAVPVIAQTSAAVAKPAGPLSYDLSKEVTLSGTVSSILTKPSSGMIMGAHLLVQTHSGVVDASLDRFALNGYGALQVTGGEAVSVTGVMKTLNGKQVLLTRTVKVGNDVYTIRNANGVAISPLARQRAGQLTGGKGLLR